MLCSKCYKKILKDEEIQLEGSIVCKDCTINLSKLTKKEGIAKCSTCYWPIYKGDLVHESFQIMGIGIGIINLSKNEKSNQCHWCYKMWINELKREKDWWKKRNEWFWLFIIFLLGIGCFLLLYLDLKIISLIAFVPLISLLSLRLLYYLYIRIIKRYKFRKREKE